MTAQSKTREAERSASAAKPSFLLPLLGLLIGVWAIIPPYVNRFGDLNVESRVEFADHVLPGIAVLAISVLAYLVVRSAEPSHFLLFVGGGVIVLAGLWMVATHAPLVSQYRNDMVAGGAVLWHGLPGVGVFLLGVVWVLRFWGDADEVDKGASGS